MIQRIVLVSFSFWFGFVGATGLSGHDLKFKKLFPSNRVLQIKINVAEDDWESIRYVRRDLRTELAPERQFGPLKGPYEYIMADIVIDGVKFKNVGLRKKGLLGSQSVTRPSFKIKLNYKNKKQDIDGYSLLTLNNNQQDPAGLSQFMGYRFFQKAGLAAPRCALAHVTFNGKNFGVYTHVESAKAPLAQNNFGNSNGTLYEGTVNDFHLGWEDSFDRKFGDDSPGKKRLKALIQSLEKAKDGAPDNFDLVKSVEASVDLDHFFKYWAVESLLGFWDGYSGNRNNFFIYVNSENDKIYFLPWGGDCMFQKYSMVDRDPRLPLSVKTKGMLAYHLYQNESARERYRTTLLDVLSIHWNEAELLDESERVQQMAEPYFTGFQKSRSNRDAIRRFIRNRRDEVMDEIADGMPNWDRKPGDPAVITKDSDWGRKKPESEDPNDLWLAAKNGNMAAVNALLNNGVPADKANQDGTTPLIMAALAGKVDVARLLIEKGAQVNARANDGNTAIHSAAFLGHWRVVELLVEHDVDLLCLNRSGETPLDVASGDWDEAVDFTMRINDMLSLNLNLRQSKKNRSRVSKHLKKATELQRKKDIWGAAKDGKFKMVADLLENGMNVDQRNPAGNTPLLMAAMGGKSEIARLLIEKGANVDARSNDGNTPIHSAAFLGHLRVVKLLVKNEVNLNALNPQNQTPLQVAMAPWSEASRYTQQMNNMLDLGIDLKRSEKNRKTVAEFLQITTRNTDSENSNQ